MRITFGGLEWILQMQGTQHQPRPGGECSVDLSDCLDPWQRILAVQTEWEKGLLGHTKSS